MGRIIEVDGYTFAKHNGVYLGRFLTAGEASNYIRALLARYKERRSKGNPPPLTEVVKEALENDGVKIRLQTLRATLKPRQRYPNPEKTEVVVGVSVPKYIIETMDTKFSNRAAAIRIAIKLLMGIKQDVILVYFDQSPVLFTMTTRGACAVHFIKPVSSPHQQLIKLAVNTANVGGGLSYIKDWAVASRLPHICNLKNNDTGRDNSNR